MITTAKEQITNVDLDDAHIVQVSSVRLKDAMMLTATVWKGGVNITDKFHPLKFLWTRTSQNHKSDTEWNNRHKGVGRTITITNDDMWGKTVFECMINIKD